MACTEECTCDYRASTDGCTEWSCIYHGRDNREKSEGERANCPVHLREAK